MTRPRSWSQQISRRPNRGIVLLAVVVAAAGVIGVAPAGGAEPDGRVTATVAFVAPSERSAAPAPVDPDSVARSRAVALAPGLLDALATGGGPIILNLFPDVEILVDGAVTSRRDADSFSWRGTAPGGGKVLLVTHEGALTGHVAADGATHEIRPLGEGLHAVVTLDTATAVAETHRTPGSFTGDAEPAPAGRADGDTIDVMILWTPAARDAAGGSAGITALTQLMVDQANLALTTSDVGHHVTLVHADEIDYVESDDPAVALDILTCDGADFPWDSCRVAPGLDEVHVMRDLYGADLVTLVVDRPRFAGIAWTPLELNPLYEALGFSIIDVDTATTNYSFVHELAHNQGAGHDRAAADAGPAAYAPYAAAHVSDGVFRTVMAYADSCTSPCPRILAFSNPDASVEIEGKEFVLGSASPDAPEDNARVLDEFFSQVSAYRTASTLVDDDGDGAPDQIDVCPGIFDPDQEDTDGDGVGDACDPDDDGDGLLDAVDAFPLMYSVCDGVPATIVGTDGDDQITGTDGPDVVMGFAGDDVVITLEGNDLVCAGAGADEVDGGEGNDTLWGEDGDDLLVGGEGNDSLHGGDGADRIESGGGADHAYGGDGNDRIDGDGGNDVLSGGPGRDRLDGGPHQDRLTGDEDGDWLWGSSGGDILSGNDGSDFLYGGLGNDELDGGPGNDKLFGDAGNDVLNGSWGNDQLRGQAGLDRVDGGFGDDWCTVEDVIRACEIIIGAPAPSPGRV